MYAFIPDKARQALCRFQVLWSVNLSVPSVVLGIAATALVLLFR